MSSAPADRDNYCYRHPNRESYVLCQRCGRTICGECQTPAPVGVICPECMRESRAATPKVRGRTVGQRLSATGAPVTVSLIALNAIVFVANMLTGGLINAYLTYYPVYTEVQPWTMLTSLFAHSGFGHIIFNMLALFLVGRDLENLLGKARFLALYFLAGFGGSVAVLLLSPLGGVLGASGSVFGLFGAYIVIVRRLGGNATAMLVLLGINFALAFLPGNRISWQGHLGGLVIGALVGLIYASTRQRPQRGLQVGLLIATGVALVLITVLALATYF